MVRRQIGTQTSDSRASALRRVAGLFAAAGLLACLLFGAAASANPNQGPGGPILVVTSPNSTFGRYYAEILRTEGLNAFAVSDIGLVTPQSLVPYDVVVLARMSLTAAQVDMLGNWVDAGGKLIAMDPDPQLAWLLGVAPSGGTLSRGYLRFDTLNPIAAGISGETLQFQTSARLNSLNGATSLATLYSTATASTPYPAVTLRNVGANGGQAAYFAFDLATSIVYTRQGNPAWSGQERDGYPPIRPNDLFYGAAAFDPQQDWVDLTKVSIPQADEQQRFLANLVTEMAKSRMPLPRFWYFPNGHRAAVILTGDDHASGPGPTGVFEVLKSRSPASCSVSDWQCPRMTTYVYPGTALSNSQAVGYSNDGFEVASHITTNCQNFDASSLTAAAANDLGNFAATYPTLPAPATVRYHCIVWSDWATGAKVQFNYGIRFDTNYYYWPPGWVNNTPGHFTGSAMPMRFADLDGTLIDVFQAPTQMTDESSQVYPFTVNELLDRALGAEQHFGAFTANAHTDGVNDPIADPIIQSALTRGVPIITSRQMLEWLDGRNASSFGSLSWTGSQLSLTVTAGPMTNGLQGMIPLSAGSGVVTSIRRGSVDVPFTVVRIKGLDYAMFPALGGSYVVSYGADSTPPTLISQSPSPGATGVAVSASVAATFSEGLDPATVSGSTFELRDISGAVVPASVSYSTATRTATLVPSAALAAGATYTVSLRGGATDPRIKDLAGNALATSASWSFSTATPPSPGSGSSMWDDTVVPGTPASTDASSVELGVKFRASVDGYVTGIRFYKGSGNTGTHIGNVWTSAGTLLANATFTSESATGWQTVTLQAPVAITAGTTYVASYFAPSGRYAVDVNYFTAGITSGALYFPSSAESGGNGVYRYGTTSGFPSESWNSSNYWVDVVFAASSATDSTPPTVTSRAPSPGATGISMGSSVTATFSETLDASTVTSSTFELRDAGNSLVPATVSYNATSRVATLVPSAPLQPGVAHTARLLGGTSDPRIMDVAGNALGTDVIWSFSTAAADTTPPIVTAQSPAPSAAGVAVNATVTATFSEALDATTVGTPTFELRDAGNSVVPATVTYDVASRVATLQPTAPLAASATYSATLKGGAADPRIKDAVGNALAANVTWSFSTAVPGACPCTIWPDTAVPAVLADSDTTAVELGVRFRASTDGYVTGIRFYKSAQNSGTHTGRLWAADGTLLATVTFTGETTSGWQTASFATPVAITAGTVYMASYHAPVGRYSADSGYFAGTGLDSGPLRALRDGESGANGVYRYGPAGSFPDQTWQSGNYWVDVVFAQTTVDTTPPTVTARAPASGATSVAVGTTVTATFSEPLDANTVNGTTFELRDPSQALVSAVVTYSAVTRTAALAPNAPLAAGATYTVSVKGGPGEPNVKDLAGNAMFGTSVWAFTTAVVDTAPPTVVGQTPAQGATGVAVGTAVTATFGEPLDPASVGSSSFELSDAGNSLVAATVSYSASTRIATLLPQSPLGAGLTYTATLRGGGGTSSIRDLAGNALAADVSWSFTTQTVAAGCAANPIAAENCLPGNPASEWDVASVGDPSIQGFATDISVNRGETISFKVATDASSYRFDIYRLGYYGGLGARKVATVQPSAQLPQSQPGCLTIATTGLIDCGNWAVSGSWSVPADATSGVYIARPVRSDTGGASHIVFVVRDDISTADILFQTSDTTWQAYNSYGGNSLYIGSPAGRAYKVSYNRPFTTRAVDNGQDWLFNAEYPMIRWLEANGYNVAYFTGVDSDRRGAQIRNHRVFLSVGHDEYWSGAQRANVEAARDAGVSLAFLSGNEVFWKTRWESSIDGSGTTYRTLVSYKETHANAKIDPSPEWTGTWRDPRFSPPADGGRPENALTGTIFYVNDGPGGTASMVVPAEDGKMRFWRNTSVAALAAGDSETLPNGVMGYEWDIDADNGFRPAGLIRMSSTTISGVSLLQDFGSTYASGTANHALTLYRAPSGALVFGAGTVQWSWGLDATHDRAGTPADVRVQQAMVNLLADMRVQPASLRAGLVATAATTDVTAPVSTIVFPAQGAALPLGTVTVTGTALDAGGGVVGGVEVSMDGGGTWRRASGRASWSYSFSPAAAGSITIRVRAVDDSGNLEVPGSGVTVSVGGGGGSNNCPCTIWDANATPAVLTDPGTQAVELGVRFRATVDGQITGLRFYKGAQNTGAHVASLWTASGALLATATFTNETASGWQQVDFATPVQITAGTVYVASYYAPNGRYSYDSGYFASTGIDRGPLSALRDGESGANGLYAYSATSTFPTQSWQSSNYWVDVVFVDQPSTDTTPPTVVGQTPAAGATGVAVSASVTATFSEDLDAATVSGSTFELRDAGSNLVAAAVSYNATTRVATLVPTAALAGSTTYTATLRGGATDPRIKDAAGNALAANVGWSFTTVAADTTPPTVTSRSPTSGATGVSRTANVTATFSEAIDAATVSTVTFLLVDTTTNAVVSAVASYNATSRVATLNPSITLAASRVYTATLRGGVTDPRIKDLAGNAMAADVTWSFTTVADTTQPTVTSRSPAVGATGVSRTANITATFSEPMDPATISASTFELRDSVTNTLVPAVVTYSATNRRATLNPDITLAAQRVYVATVKGGATDPRAKDQAGNSLASDVTWSFTTR